MIPNECKLEVFEILKANLNVNLHLFKADILISPTTVLSNFTLADYKGYASYNLKHDNFSPVIIENNKAVLIANDFWVFNYNSAASGSASNVIYGYLLEQNNHVIEAQKLLRFITMDADGKQVWVKPYITLGEYLVIVSEQRLTTSTNLIGTLTPTASGNVT